jgi:hypothetical protein
VRNARSRSPPAGSVGKLVLAAVQAVPGIVPTPLAGKFTRVRNEVVGDLIVVPQCSNTGGQMLFWNSWIEAAQFSFEAQSVVTMRLMKIATGGQDGAAECTRMVLEKIDAVTAAHTAGALALAGGKSIEAATKLAMAPVKRRVRANHLRLTRG